MGQAASHNHHGTVPGQHGDRPRSIGGSGVNFGSGNVPHGVHSDLLKDGSPFDGQVNLNNETIQTADTKVSGIPIRCVRNQF